MKTLIDADACPVVDIVMECAIPKGIEVILVCDSSHWMERDGARTITVARGADSADFKLVNLIQTDDIVVTQDYGLAAMAMAKKARVLNQNGLRYSDENIDSLLLSRHIAKKIRQSGGRIKGPAKRTLAQDDAFREAYQMLLKTYEGDRAEEYGRM